MDKPDDSRQQIQTSRLFQLDPVKSFIINPHPELGTLGLEVGFDARGFVGVRAIESPDISIGMTRDAAIQLAELILREINE